MTNKAIILLLQTIDWMCSYKEKLLFSGWWTSMWWNGFKQKSQYNSRVMMCQIESLEDWLLIFKIEGVNYKTL